MPDAREHERRPIDGAEIEPGENEHVLRREARGDLIDTALGAAACTD